MRSNSRTGTPTDGCRVQGLRRRRARKRSAGRFNNDAKTHAAALLPLALLNAVIEHILQENLSPGVTSYARFGIGALLFSP